MHLKDTMERVLDLSRLMYEALDRDDVPAALEQLVAREQAMAAFIEADQAASAPEKSACADLLTELKLADRELQDLAATVMAASKTEMCRSLGVPAGAPDARQCRTGCLDRRA